MLDARVLVRRARPAIAGLLVLAAASGLGAGLAVAAGARPAATSARPLALLTLVQYPTAGFGGIRSQIAAARRSVDMEMYELADPAVERALASAAARGVRVRVLLDRAFHGGEVNAAAYRYLSGHRVGVRWAPSGVIFHIKATSFDGAVSDVSTANLVAKYYATSRDAEIVDRDPAQVRAIEATFDGDWRAGPSGVPRSATVQAPGLVWSPNTGSGSAQTALVAQIAAARHALDFTSEELADPAVYGALAAAARRGVDCRVVMTRSSEWDRAFAAITRAGCHVHLFPDSASALYIHEKLILDDPGTATESMFLGSQNASVTSLTRNRELGVVLGTAHGGDAAISSASATFDSDYARAPAWSGSGGPGGGSGTGGSAACRPRTSAGHCYEPGELCRAGDHGASGVSGGGDPIVCEDRGGWRWERARQGFKQ